MLSPDATSTMLKLFQPIPTASAASSNTTPVNTSASSTVNSINTPAPTPTTQSTSSSVTADAPGTSSSSSAINGTSTDAAAAADSSSFTLPGKKLSVLPIGLGVFAGVSVIALIVVGLVTYERTKYRKASNRHLLISPH